MKCRTGWLVSENVDTKKMIPFFVNVRSGDIFMTDGIAIDAALKQTSTRWKLEREEERVDCNFYHYVASWQTTSDSNAETVGSDRMDSYLDYYIYKDGRLEIDGIVRASGTYTAIDSNYGTISSKIYLPFAFNSAPLIRSEYGYGACEHVTSIAKVSGAKITNQRLNLNSTDKNDYLFLLTMTAIVPVNGSVAGAVPIERIRAIAETEATYKNASYSSYITSFFPYHIHYNGYWRDHNAMEVEKPESQNDELTGTYITTSAINLYTGPSTKSTIIRTLSPKTSLKCSGYYTENKEGAFLYVYYPPTSQYGYASVEYVRKQ